MQWGHLEGLVDRLCCCSDSSLSDGGASLDGETGIGAEGLADLLNGCSPSYGGAEEVGADLGTAPVSGPIFIAGSLAWMTSRVGSLGIRGDGLGIMPACCGRSLTTC